MKNYGDPIIKDPIIRPKSNPVPVKKPTVKKPKK